MSELLNNPAAYWNKRYSHADTGWDMGHVSPALKAYIDLIHQKDISILIPGCGNAYEAEYLMDNGFKNVTVLDISPILIEDLKKKFTLHTNNELQLVCSDFFEWEGHYDLILEQTFFCALDPLLRTKYRDHMNALLKDGGKLSGLLFNKTFDNSPPFGGNREEYQQLFSSHFDIVKMEDCNLSIPPRMGAELFVEMVKKK